MASLAEGGQFGARRAPLWAAAAWCGVFLGYFVSSSFDPHAADFKTFYSAGYAVTHPDIPLYDVKEIAENPFGQVFKLPPTAALLMAPLSLLSLQEARLVWRAALLAAYFSSLFVLCRGFGIRSFSTGWLLAFAAWSIFAPAHIAIGEGQWDPVLLLLLSWAAVGVARGADGPAAVAVAAAASIKLYPVAVGLYFLACRGWKGLLIVGGCLGALAGTSFIVVGADESTAFITRVVPAAAALTGYPDNQSIGGFIARLVSNDVRPVPMRDAATTELAARLVAVALIAICLVLGLRSRPTSALDRAVLLSLFVPLSILVLPAAWSHYQTILLLPLFLFSVDQAKSGGGLTASWLLIGVAFALAAAPNPALIIGEDVDRALWLRNRADAANALIQRQFPGPIWRLAISYKLLGTAMVGLLVAQRVRRMRFKLGGGSSRPSAE